MNCDLREIILAAKFVAANYFDSLSALEQAQQRLNDVHDANKAVAAGIVFA